MHTEERDSLSGRVSLVCPVCRGVFTARDGAYECTACARKYPVINDVPVLLSDEDRKTAEFYEEFHKVPHKAFDLSGVGEIIQLNPFIRKHRGVFEKILNIPFKRERFFKKVRTMLRTRAEKPVILDLGCGGGNEELLEAGDLYGVDFSIWALLNGNAIRRYVMRINGDATMLPFEDSTFDCIVSSDFIGHIPSEKKEKLFAEMSRVLKEGGICGHVIETDADTFIHRFEKSRPDLYRKYFVEGAGGHVGLERPSRVLARFRNAGMEPVAVHKYFTYVRDIESFIALFDNEYRQTSSVVRWTLAVYKLLSRNFPVKITASVLSGLISYFVDALTPLNAAEGLLVIGVKRGGAEGR